MSLTRVIFKNLILLLGWIAVFLGALEHEDLILQKELLGEVESAEQRRAGASAPRFQADIPDSGTESTFRQELFGGHLLGWLNSQATVPGDLRPLCRQALARHTTVAVVLAPGARDRPLRL